MGWIYLFIAILLETSGTMCMKLSDGFTKIVPSVLLFVFYIASFAVMTLSLKTINISIAYAVWAGVGTALITIAGMILFREPVNTIKIISILFIIIGVVGLYITGE